ncbi:biotin--[acetyl-CoA-carboxylase] ligase [Aliarcobacter butzleri]|uniref:Biotin--acetyl-CoA-carboxylase ligase n=1 Tax=Aliarcobacter butzleri (strain RM4018) TaxID=367737 RepID=A8EV78_ALIB4|nr:biotin--[acetyl-CoA-carboxylase] ligase [Aliarcobacter butzleri]ABV67851.1 biotin--acetyl-CoA-carboxylase ligase [Aliarcobacter butzleri RM4018]MCG3651441.1 biotin--[acetyl-CoA-carboxylase] ligase [Aliarcobacter butzleri]MCG3671821.1 biotin--[acetyl-CoA-carboxylase] ligase [Aliarcobacter butzleri]MCG3690012.1 biotin--[acetyl-CoA-carboxylase] ligase [Aliarcobacter butzleri]MDN5068453.1 biotin--[acetyl-CoA-carboxylase] ligase [Aliarcobacter butzleri]
MKIIRLDEVDSTHKYLKEYISKNEYTNPLCIVTDLQTQGIGSRGNSWIGKKGNLFFSFALDINSLPKNLPLQSTSIYFTYILKNILKNLGSQVWIKWPNDFYIENKKIGGTITSMSKNQIFCGIGLNLLDVEKEYEKLDIKIDVDEVLKNYFFEIEKKISWKQIFSDFKIEFEKSKKFQTTIDNQKISLESAILNDDGSIQINNKKVFSLR